MNRHNWILAFLAAIILGCLVFLAWAIPRCEKPAECAATAAAGIALGMVIAGGKR